MEKIQEETQLQFTKKQLQSIINLELEKENGLNDLFTMMINGLMLSERKIFLSNKEDPNNISISPLSNLILTSLTDIE